MHPSTTTGKNRAIIDNQAIITQHHSQQFCARSTFATRNAGPNRIHLTSFPHFKSDSILRTSRTTRSRGSPARTARPQAPDPDPRSMQQ